MCSCFVLIMSQVQKGCDGRSAARKTPGRLTRNAISFATVHLTGRPALCRAGCFEEMTMRTRVKIFAIAAALVAGVSSVAMAEYPCAPGYALYGRVCQPTRPLGYSNPVSGAVSGEAAGAASGYRTAGPVGAVVGGALGTAAGTLSGTGNMLSGGSTPPRACAWGYHWYNGYCYPNR
jgi:hypothetical protein